MNINDIPLPLTGDALIKALTTAKDARLYVADNLIYEQTITMLASDPGIGKSTITVQMAVELAAGLPVFGVFHVPRPMRVLLSQNERSALETLERIEALSNKLPIVKENLFITDGYQGLNLLVPDQAQLFRECVKRDCPGADVIFLDPIYCLVAGGLKDDVPASAFTKCMSVLQRETKAALWYNHHTVKASYSSHKGDKIEREDPFYGSQWLKAHVTGSFYMQSCDNGVKLTCKKDNYRVLPDNIILEYDNESGMCSVEYEHLPALDKVKTFLRARQLDQKEFSFNEIQKTTQVCTRRLRDLLLHSSIKEMISVVSTSKRKHLYRVTQPQI